MSYTKIMPRGGTKYEWTTMNPVLAEREMAVEYPDTGIGTGLCRFKFGDGFKTYNELAYAFDGASASSMIGGSAFSGNVFQIRADTHENWLLANPVLEENELVYDTTNNCFYIGDGASRFNQLTPAGRDAQRVYDFGDEDEDDIVSPITSSISGASASPAALFTAGTSTLGDLMDMALGGMIDPQPIEGGTPLILDSLSDSMDQAVSASATMEVIEQEEEIVFDDEAEELDDGIIKDDGYSIIDEQLSDEDSGEEGQIPESEEEAAEHLDFVDQLMEDNPDIVEIIEDSEEVAEDEIPVEEVIEGNEVEG